MKELLFGWITKGQYNLSFLDSIIAFIEIFILVLIVAGIGYLIQWIYDKYHNTKR